MRESPPSITTLNVDGVGNPNNANSEEKAVGEWQEPYLEEE